MPGTLWMLRQRERHAASEYPAAIRPFTYQRHLLERLRARTRQFIEAWVSPAILEEYADVLGDHPEFMAEFVESFPCMPC